MTPVLKCHGPCSRPKKKGLTQHNIFVTLKPMDYTITYYSESVQEQILDLPDTLAARYVVLTRRMVAIGPNLGEPHTKAFGDGLFELRLKGAEGIARVPKRELDVAHTRLKEIKHANT